MTYCEYCGAQMGYLPFNCKYCGGTFCKKHRLPENHECTFELKHVSLVPIASNEAKRQYKDVVLSESTTPEYLTKGPRGLKKYLKRQEKQRRQTTRSYRDSYRTTPQYNYTKILFSMILIFSIIGLIFKSAGIPQYLYFSLPGLIYYYTYHTFFTALFVSSTSTFITSSDIIGLIFLFIMVIFLYIMARNIELNFGWKFLIKLYIFCCLFSAGFYIILRLLLTPIYPLNYSLINFGLAWGGIYGLLSYTIFPIMNRQITGLMAFLPLRMRGRSFLLMIVLIRLIPGLFFALYIPFYLLFYLPELGGILGSYIVYRYKFNRY